MEALSTKKAKREKAKKIIIVEERGCDHRAHVKGNPKTWECGKTVNAAIGKLLWSLYGADFKIEQYNLRGEKIK